MARLNNVFVYEYLKYNSRIIGKLNDKEIFSNYDGQFFFDDEPLVVTDEEFDEIKNKIKIKIYKVESNNEFSS